jgi:formate dehydrogenase (NADP+) beta subunit
VLKTRVRARDGSHYMFDYGYCKGCGLCAHECPNEFIAMVEEAWPQFPHAGFLQAE